MLSSLKDFEIFANLYKIPILLEVRKEDLSINLFYFKKDKNFIERASKLIPVHILVFHYIIEDHIAIQQIKLIYYSQHFLVECTERIKMIKTKELIREK